MPANNNKVIPDLKKLKDLCNKYQGNGKHVVFTNGCFDIIHAGHVHLLNEAKSFGDILVVAINSDSSVKKIKPKTSRASS